LGTQRKFKLLATKLAVLAKLKNGHEYTETMPIDTFLAIKQNIPNLPSSMKKVAHVLVDDPIFVSRSTLAQVAERCGVSEPTVLRFIRKNNFVGFRDFQYMVIQFLAAGTPAAFSNITPTDDIEDVVGKLFDKSIQTLANARKNLDVSAIKGAVDAIASASSVLVLGYGASAIVAQDIAQKFPLFGKPIHAPTDSHQQFMAAAVADSSTVVLAISNTGQTIELLRAVSVAKSCGAVVVSITEKHSLLAKLSDIVIVGNSEDNTDIFTPSTSRLVDLVIIDILAASTSSNFSEQTLENLNRMKSLLSKMRAGEEESFN